MATVIRPRKDGGYSECSSPDELVGKGRCVHILDEGRPVMSISKISRGSYEVDLNEGENLTINASKEIVAKFFENLNTIDEKKTKEIVDYLMSLE